jgi:Fe2+ or Zn2+ uptake regulation protein
MSSGETESIFEILRYLKEHPKARDTIEGISWWVLEQRMNDCVSDVQSTLSQLLAQGLLLVIEGGDARRHYQLNHGRLDEIDLILRGHDI